jgi:peptide/nickel transport system substrate-binding protein
LRVERHRMTTSPIASPGHAVSIGGKVVKVDRVEWVVLPDPQTAVQALNRGEIDFMELQPTDLLPLLKANKDLKWKT